VSNSTSPGWQYNIDPTDSPSTSSGKRLPTPQLQQPSSWPPYSSSLASPSMPSIKQLPDSPGRLPATKPYSTRDTSPPYTRPLASHYTR
jgi:hypothetical protein